MLATQANFVMSYMNLNKKCKQTLERTQYGLEIIFKMTIVDKMIGKAYVGPSGPRNWSLSCFQKHCATMSISILP